MVAYKWVTSRHKMQTFATNYTEVYGFSCRKTNPIMDKETHRGPLTTSCSARYQLTARCRQTHTSLNKHLDFLLQSFTIITLYLALFSHAPLSSCKSFSMLSIFYFKRHE